MDVNTGSWKKGLIADIFSKDESKAICSISLSRMGAQDKMIWDHSNKVIFSVKSAYHLEHSRLRARKDLQILLLLRVDGNQYGR